MLFRSRTPQASGHNPAWLLGYEAAHPEAIIVHPEQTVDFMWKVYFPNQRVRPYHSLDAMKQDLDPQTEVPGLGPWSGYLRKPRGGWCRGTIGLRASHGSSE